MRVLVLLFGLLLVMATAHAQDSTTRVFPEFQLTPGGLDDSLTPQYLCSHSTSDRRLVPLPLRKEVFATYGVSFDDRSGYEVDHFVPLFLGGVNTCESKATCNLWPQPHQKVYSQVAPWGSETKDKLETRVYNTMCNRKTHKAVKDAQWLHDAQQAMMRDWRAMYEQYFGEPEASPAKAVSRKRTRRTAK
jgi:hypothetical protein